MKIEVNAIGLGFTKCAANSRQLSNMDLSTALGITIKRNKLAEL
jgi:hypothetical protein